MSWGECEFLGHIIGEVNAERKLRIWERQRENNEDASVWIEGGRKTQCPVGSIILPTPTQSRVGIEDTGGESEESDGARAWVVVSVEFPVFVSASTTLSLIRGFR